MLKFSDQPKIKSVQIATTSVCNAKCVFCPYPYSWHAKNPGQMTDKTWERVLFCLKPWQDSIKKICPYLMQEPFTDHKIWDRVRDLYREFPNAKIEISTNAALLDESIARKLIDLFVGRKHEVWISHHGINKETFEKVMNLPYRKCLDNILRFIDLADGRLSVRIIGRGESAPTMESEHDWSFSRDQYFRYWRNMIGKADDPRIRFDYQNDRDWIRQQNPGVVIASEQFHNRAGSLESVKPSHTRRLHGCDRITEWVHVMYDGQLVLCCMDYHRKIILPNLNDITLIDWFNSDEYDDLRSIIEGRSESPDDFICYSCPYMADKERDLKHPKVFCIGYPRTGSTSLGLAMSILGYTPKKVYSRFMEWFWGVDDITKIFDTKFFTNAITKSDFVSDWPIFLLYKELDRRYPGSKFILTTRRHESVWLDSVKRHVAFHGGKLEYVNGKYVEHWGGLALPSYDYHGHIDEVLSYFGNSDRLLTMCIEDGNHWEELCEFLDIPIPNEKFPYLNKG